MRPLLFLDVDGPLNPFHASLAALQEGYTAHSLRPRGWAPPLSALRVLLNPDHGAQLLGLPYELVWATTWEHEANSMIGPRVGLPELPVVELPARESAPAGIFFKTPALVEYAAGRPFVWVDDEVTDRDHEYVGRHHRGAFLLHRISPAQGLVERDLDL
uniref:hypothetical protein n=1 Tax=Nocardiopsis salina TaxID=245836 RepID=UPI000373D8D6